MSCLCVSLYANFWTRSVYCECKHQPAVLCPGPPDQTYWCIGDFTGNKQAGAMTQLLFWIGLFEFLTFPAVYDSMQGGSRAPGDYMFDPLGVGKKDLASMQLKEIKNGRLAMIGIGGMIHHYLLTGKGPMAFLGGIPNYKSCIAPHIPSLCQ